MKGVYSICPPFIDFRVPAEPTSYFDQFGDVFLEVRYVQNHSVHRYESHTHWLSMYSIIHVITPTCSCTGLVALRRASVDLFRRSWVQTQTCALISISLETSYSCLWFKHFSHSIKTGIALELDGPLCCDHWPPNSVTSFLPCTFMSIKRRFT